MTARGVAAAGYVATVAGLAGSGFGAGSTPVILLAVALTLPVGIPALVGFYLAYGLLAQVPGANPHTFNASESCRANGVCECASTGDLATWFLVTTDALGVAALTLAATTNVVLLGLLLGRRRRRGAAADSSR